MAHHFVCPSWLGYLLLCPLRRLVHNPDGMLAPFVTNGMTVLEVGPGMGFFTLPMARMVGPSGRIVCLDVQEKMLAAVRRRAVRAGLADQIEARACEPATLGIADLAAKVDFVLLYYVVHEVPSSAGLFAEVAAAMKQGSRCLLAEPRFHVTAGEFERMMAEAAKNGLRPVEQPRIRGSLSAVLERQISV